MLSCLNKIISIWLRLNVLIKAKMGKYNSFREINFDSADKLWEQLSPTKNLPKSPSKFIYRGQENAEWGLIPSILRNKNRKLFAKILTGEKYDDQIFTELILLRTFMTYCDAGGINIPNDSLEFRERNLNINKQDDYYLSRKKWPNEELFGFMALAQHHGVLTRLLDWSKNPYVAVYFTASRSLSSVKECKGYQSLAIWALNIETINLYPRIKIISPPGSISHYLAAQSGLFTVQIHEGIRDSSFEVINLESEFSSLPDTPLIKFTVPIKECRRLLELCLEIGINGATLFPGADGAGRAVQDEINLWCDRYRELNC